LALILNIPMCNFFTTSSNLFKSKKLIIKYYDFNEALSFRRDFINLVNKTDIDRELKAIETKRIKTG